MLLALSFSLISILAFYFLFPWRDRKTYENYLAVISIFETQCNSLIEVFASQIKNYNDVLDSRSISKSNYDALIQKTYEHVINHIPSYIKNRLTVYLSTDEIQKLVLYKIDLIYKEHFANAILQNEDLIDDNVRAIKPDFFNVEENPSIIKKGR